MISISALHRKKMGLSISPAPKAYLGGAGINTNEMNNNTIPQWRRQIYELISGSLWKIRGWEHGLDYTTLLNRRFDLTNAKYNILVVPELDKNLEYLIRAPMHCSIDWNCFTKFRSLWKIIPESLIFSYHSSISPPPLLNTSL